MHPKETLVFPFRALPPSRTPATRQFCSGRADLRQVVEAVDVGNEIGRKDGAVPGSAPCHELLPEPAGEDTQVTLTVGVLRMAHLRTRRCQETAVAGPNCPLCIRLYADVFFPAVITCVCIGGEWMVDNYGFRVRSPERAHSTFGEMPGISARQISDFTSQRQINCGRGAQGHQSDPSFLWLLGQYNLCPLKHTRKGFTLGLILQQKVNRNGAAFSPCNPSMVC